MKKITLDGSAKDNIFIPDNTTACVFCDLGSDKELQITVGRDSVVNIFVFQVADASLVQKNIVGANSMVFSNALWLEGGKVTITNSLEGENSEAYDTHLFVIGKNNSINIDSVLRHAAKDTRGNIFVKGIVKDSAYARIDGMIKIEKNAPGANSFLDEHAILFNPGARADTNPELEIENNDVQSSHAASIRPIDEEKIFYLQSRGLSRDNAKTIIVEGFLKSVLARFHDVGYKNRISSAIEACF